MKQTLVVKHELQILDYRFILKREAEWTPKNFEMGMFRPARILANRGKLTEAIEEAREIAQRYFRKSSRMDFRVVSQTTTETYA